MCKNQGPAPKQESESHDHQMGLYYGITTRVSPQNLLWCGVPHYYGTNTRRRGPSRPGALCPDSVELHGGNVPQEEGGWRWVGRHGLLETWTNLHLSAQGRLGLQTDKRHCPAMIWHDARM